MSSVQSLTPAVLAGIRAARRIDDLKTHLRGYAAAFGCGAHQLASGPRSPFPDPAALLALGDFPRPWADRFAREFDVMNDPVLVRAADRAGPVRWAPALAQARSPQARAVVQSYRDQGFRDGLTAPVHGPQGCVAVLMLGARTRIDPAPDDCDALGMVAMAAYNRTRQILAAALFAPPDPVALTERERVCLSWVLEGKTNWEIGRLTGVTERTVQFHLGNAARKLGAVNRTQAAVQALMRGEVRPGSVTAVAPAQAPVPAHSPFGNTPAPECEQTLSRG